MLGLLSSGPRHGYELKQLYDEALSPDRPVPPGQVYSTLSRLERDELVGLDAVVQGDGPDRKLYSLTAAGDAQVDEWLREAENPEPRLQATLYMKVVLCILTGRSVDQLFDTQRSAHLERMRQLTARRRNAPPSEALLADYALFHLEADLRWLEVTAARVADLKRDLRQFDPRTEL